MLAQELNTYYQEILYQNDELHRITEELGLSESRFRFFFMLAPIGYIIHTQEGEIQNINQYMVRLLETDEAALLKTTFEQWIHPEDQDRYYLFLRQVKNRADRKEQNIQIRLRSKNLKEIPVILSSILDPERPEIFWTSCIDNTIEQNYKHEIQSINRDLIILKNRLDLIMEKSKVGWWNFEISTGKVLCSSNKFSLLGLPATTEAVNYTLFTSLVHPDDLDRINQAMEQTIRYGVPYDVEYRIRHADGTYRWVRDSGLIDTTQTGKPTHVSGLIQDITLVKTLSQQLGDELKRYKTLFSHLPIGLLLFKNGHLVMSNRLAKQYLHLSRQDLGQHIDTIFNRFTLYNKYYRPLKSEKTLHCTHLMNRHIQIHDDNDQVRYLQIQAIFKDNPSECIVSLEDVTELETNRQLEEKARNTLQLFMDNIPEPVIITDQNGDIIQVNRSLEKLYGYSKEEVLGKNPRILNPGKEIYETIGLTEELYHKQFTELWESLLDT